MLRLGCRTGIRRPLVYRTPFNVSSRFARHASFKNEGNTDDKIQFKWFLLVGVFGTLVYMTVMQRIQEQDHSKNLEKYKKTFTEEERAKYINEIQRKKLTLESDEECYLLPFTKSLTPKITAELKQKLGGEASVAVIDLNELVADQINNKNGKEKYNVLLNSTLEEEIPNPDTFKFKFNYKLKPGIFTQIVSDKISKLKEENPQLGRFIIVNYPPNIKEAIKFGQNVCHNDHLLILNNESDHEDVVQYYETVDKVVNARNLKQLQPLKIDTDAKPRVVEQVETFKINTLPNELPENASSIHKAQFKLRELGHPIRLYGESDLDVINRLKSLK